MQHQHLGCMSRATGKVKGVKLVMPWQGKLGGRIWAMVNEWPIRGTQLQIRKVP